MRLKSIVLATAAFALAACAETGDSDETDFDASVLSGEEAGSRSPDAASSTGNQAADGSSADAAGAADAGNASASKDSGFADGSTSQGDAQERDTSVTSTIEAGRGGDDAASSDATAGDAGASDHITHSGPVRIMALGDSTTGSVCFRAKLWQALNKNGFTGKFDFVGSRRNDPGCGVSGYDLDNEGHPSVLITNFVKDADDQASGTQSVDDLLGRNPADVVLFHFATNDIWNNISPAAILSAYSTVVTSLRKTNPRVIVLAATLIPMSVTANTCQGCSCPTCPDRIKAFNTMVSDWASKTTSAASPVSVVDQWTGFDAKMNVDTRDGIHPNDSGSQKMAERWYEALVPWF